MYANFSLSLLVKVERLFPIDPRSEHHGYLKEKKTCRIGYVYMGTFNASINKQVLIKVLTFLIAYQIIHNIAKIGKYYLSMITS